MIDVLTQFVSLHGAPRYLRSDYGPEFVATAVLRWLQTRGSRHRFHPSRQALAEWHERVVEREVSRRVFESEVVSESPRGKVGIERWRRHYSEERPHMSLGDLMPAEFKSKIKSQSGCLTEARTDAVLQ